MRDGFKDRANQWDDNPKRQSFTENSYNYIIDKLDIPKETKMVDLGGGTGLLTLKFLDDVSEITVVDTSSSMVEVLKEKIELNSLDNINIIQQELVDGVIEKESVDLVISSMTLHHVEDIYLQLEDVYNILSDGGKIAFIDLIEESGDFHSEGADYIHTGFSKLDILELLEFTKFINVKFKVFESFDKEGRKGTMKNFPVFIVTAEK